MIAQHQHVTIFEHVRRGHTIDVRISKVPGNIAFNQYCFREGKITDVFMNRNRIEYAVVKLFPIGYEKYNYFKFPIQHLSLIYPLAEYEKRVRYNPTDYQPAEEGDNIADDVYQDDERSEAEFDDYPDDEIEYLDECEEDDLY